MRELVVPVDPGALEPSPPALWAGRALSAGTVTFFVALAVTNLFFPQVLEEANKESGVPDQLSMLVGITALASASLYAMQRTSILGAIMITGFLGGAIAINLRVGASLLSPPVLMCLAVGAAAWGGLYLRDVTVRSILPLRSGSGVGR